ncbi:hypothetical protein GALMADRAFT_134123 [Galerina marginata CBS 339.88]|uniref:Uncharacterized protein n=1 Tax=Galerina marginata (strain CBS 339.88) TaxID=685588 RepID=A0A067TRK0_GALM3|nr:hypothetical protein GALMADRAFT_134123 [Galerina marginata CBS 339.88]
MPAELPGLYWDEARNRYFPLSSRPKQPQSQPPNAASSNVHKDAKATKVGVGQKRKPCHVPWHANLGRLATNSYMQMLKNSHEILCFQYASSSRVTSDRLPTLGSMQAFCSSHLGQVAWRFIGDDQGWLYSDKSVQPERRNGINYWSADLNLQPSSPISSIRISGSHCVTTCLGPGKLSVQDMSTPERMFLLNLAGVHDIWASDLQGQSLVLGASKKAVYISDIDLSRSPEYLQTGSDVFSVIKDKALLYAGTRNGAVERFDLRMPKYQSQKLFDNRFEGNPRSSVLHLSVIRDHGLLLSHLNGDLLTFDLRFTSSAFNPIQVFAGHINTHTRNLGITVDHERDLLFAAGQDCRIRGWSLRTGEAVLPPKSLPNVQHPANPFLTTFIEPVCALQVTEELDEAGISLWAASGRDLHQFHLGQRQIE